MFFYFVILVIGIFIFFYSLFETYTWSCLYFDRNYYCSDKYRRLQKLTDLMSIYHNLVMMMFGIFIIIYGIQNLTSISDIDDVNTFFYRWIILTCFFDNIFLIFLSIKYNLKDIIYGIETKWKKEKKFTKEHNDEVNLYKGCKRIFKIYPWQVTLSVILTVIIHNLIF